MRNRKVEIYWGDGGMGYDVYFIENGMIIKKEYYDSLKYSKFEEEASDWVLPEHQK
jgi:hypothetical protein